jgi:hypothetical protein
VLALLSALGVLAFRGESARSQQTLVITDAGLQTDAELPRLQQKDDVKVKQGRNFLNVTQLIPAQGDNAALQLTSHRY